MEIKIEDNLDKADRDLYSQLNILDYCDKCGQLKSVCKCDV